ncbi:MAG: hypothetical protein A3J93_05080 [Candidatus Magasanikbacteria bacterium RIFOXYC2_FULL_42_28]|uniref:DoxX family protein n=1 Tax=Candidatus Magasanikbacteria bacterium RIFOXYC2_FULL_42_28 TaxID=1798704 RepID=A0A1F6NVD4_9BACT|nr:MAG: hypothetical protein A3J93_05080 [Candidatus Magasanikbacteria bacterium RIFOXYC2_FULL_42_28]
MINLQTVENKLHHPHVGLLLTRVALALVFIHAGWLKVTDMDMVLTGFASMGFPAFLAYFVSYAELIGGVALLLGLGVRYVGIVLAVIMLVATKVLFGNGFGLMGGGYEYTLILMLLLIAVVTTGPGKYSVEQMMKKSAV